MYPAITGTQLPDRAAAGDDVELVRQAVEDPAAFAELYQRYRVRVYWYLRARTSNEDDAADLTQHVFTAAFARLHQYRRRKASFATWLFTIARNAATDFHRRLAFTTDWDSLPAALHPTDDGDMAGSLLHREAMLRVRHLLEQLPQDKRELLALRYGAELSIPEVAAITRKSAHATRKQLQRILQTLEVNYHDSND